MQYPIENYSGNQQNCLKLFGRPGFSTAASVVQQNVTLLILSYKKEKKFLQKLAFIKKSCILISLCPFVPDYSAYRGTNQERVSKEVARLPLHCLGRDVKESGQEHPD